MTPSTDPGEFVRFPDDQLDRITENYMAPIFDAILDRYSMGTVLDYGCGNGLFGAYFKRRTGCTLFGADGSAYGLERARGAGYDRTFHVSDFSAEGLPLDDGSVDFVMLKDVLEHLIDPGFVVAEARRVCVDGGLLLVHVPNHFPIKYRFKFLFSNDIDTQGYFPGVDAWSFPHVRFFRHGELVRRLETSGFSRIEDYSDFFTAFVPLTGRVPLLAGLQRYLARRWPSQFSTGFTVLFRKT